MKTLYLSSTYSDLAQERNLLHQQVLPQLNAPAAGEGIHLQDLHWGSPDPDSEQGCRQLLSVNLDELDRSTGGTIIFVGQRYGWIPSADLVRQVVSSRPGFDVKNLEQSIVSLEVEYNLFHRKDRQDKTLFYFRQIQGDVPSFCQPESPLHAQRLEELKERIIRFAGDRVRTYQVTWNPVTEQFDGMESLAQMVRQDLETLLSPQRKQSARLDPWQQDLQSQWAMVNQRVREFVCRSELLYPLMQQCQGLSVPVAVTGPEGSGKSTFLGRLAKEFERQGATVLPIFCGTSALCQTEGDILRYLLRFTREQLGQTAPTDPENLPEQLTAALEQYSQESGEDLVFLLDGVDRLTKDPGSMGRFFLPDFLPQKVKVIFSCQELAQGPWQTLALEPLNQSEIRQLAQSLLRSHGLEPDAGVLEALQQKPETTNPLYLTLLVQRVALMEKDDFRPSVHPSQQIKQIRASQGNIDGLFSGILATAGKLLNSNMPLPVSALLAVSLYGLRESDLEAILHNSRQHWSALAFARLKKYMGNLLFCRGDGRYDYRHRSLRQTMQELLKDRTVLHLSIFRHLLSLDPQDPVRMESASWHCLKAREYGAWVDYIQHLCPQALEKTARNTALILKEEGSGWLETLLEEGMAYGCTGEFLAFLGTPLAKELGNSQESMTLHRDLLLAAVRLAETRDQTLATEETSKTLTMCRNQAAQACSRLGDESSLASLQQMQDRQLELLEQLLDGAHSPQEKRKLMSVLEEAALSYRRQPGEAARQKVLEYQEKRLVQWRQLLVLEPDPTSMAQLAEACQALALEYETAAEPAEAAGLQEASTDLWQQVARDATDPNLRKKAAAQLLETALERIRQDQGLTAQELLETARDVCNSCNFRNGSQEEMLLMAQIQLALGQVYPLKGTQDQILLALEACQESFLIQRDLSQVQNTADSRIAMALCYQEMSRLHGMLDGDDHLHRALELMNRGLSLWRMLHTKLDSAESALGLGRCLREMGLLLPRFGGEPNLLEGKKILLSAQELYERQDLPESSQEDLRDLNLAIGEIDSRLKQLKETREEEAKARLEARRRIEEEEAAAAARLAQEEKAQQEEEKKKKKKRKWF